MVGACRWASAEGAICEEPLRGIRFNLGFTSPLAFVLSFESILQCCSRVTGPLLDASTSRLDNAKPASDFDEVTRAGQQSGSRERHRYTQLPLGPGLQRSRSTRFVGIRLRHGS